MMAAHSARRCAADCSWLAVAMLGLSFCTSYAHAENMVFPADAGVISVHDYGAVGDGLHDDTAAIQRALDEHPNRGAIIYLPHGTYLVSDTICWPHGKNGQEEKNTILQGQSRQGSVLRLADHAAGFDDPQQGKSMVWTGRAPGQRFRNALHNLTLDTGRDNPGAIALQLIANNQGGVFDVTLRSGDGRGVIGLDLAYTDEIGPCLIKNIDVQGFDVGIKASHVVNSIVLEHVRLEQQHICGLLNEGQCLSIRDLHSSNACTALVNSGEGLVAVLDSVFTTDHSSLPAIVNKAALFARNVKTTGYRVALVSKTGTRQELNTPDIDEYVSHPVLHLFAGPEHSLGLACQETPEIAWDDLSDWVSPIPYGGKPNDSLDDTVAIQKAIDSGKTTLYLPNRVWKVSDTILVRGRIRRIIGCEAMVEVPEMRGKPAFQIVDGESPVVVFERIQSGFTKTTTLENASARTLVIRHCCNVCGAMTGPGDVFIEDVCSNPFTNWNFKGQHVWARQLNVENAGTHIINDGGSLWILGLKTERGGTLIDTRSGGQTELLGGLCYTTTDPKGAPMFTSDRSSQSLVIGEASFKNTPFLTLVEERQGNEIKSLKKGDAPARAGGSMLPLYVGNAPGP